MREPFDILLLPGDGIGPEVVGAARRVMDEAAEPFGVRLAYEERGIGATAIRPEGEPAPEQADGPWRSTRQRS
jgi:3-isopropylmalate dehydrogenase